MSRENCSSWGDLLLPPVACPLMALLSCRRQAWGEESLLVRPSLLPAFLGSSLCPPWIRCSLSHTFILCLPPDTFPLETGPDLSLSKHSPFPALMQRATQPSPGLACFPFEVGLGVCSSQCAWVALWRSPGITMSSCHFLVLLAATFSLVPVIYWYFLGLRPLIVVFLHTISTFTVLTVLCICQGLPTLCP